jgi:hypothetical protein
MRIFEPVLLASMALAAPAGFVGAAYVGPSFISADFNGFDIHNAKPVSASKTDDASPIQKPKAKKPALPPDGPGLRGATRPHCSPGFYTAGYECKISPPNHYVPVGAIYPILCPPDTFASPGAQSKGQCVKRETRDGFWAQSKAVVKSALASAKISL